MEHHCWAQSELGSVRLGDKRLHPRLFAIVDTLTQRPQASIPEAFGTWAHTKAFYRFCSSDNVDAQEIGRAHRKQTLLRACQHGRLLAIQDTTEFDFTGHRATAGLGPLNATTRQGFKLHSVLAATDTGVPVGLLAAYVWARDQSKKGQSRNWRKRPLTDKETLYWHFGLSDSHSFLPETIEVICICDRQGDCFELLSAPRPNNSHLLVRAAYDRRLDATGKKLFSTLEAAPLAGVRSVRVRTHHPGSEREAVLHVRFASVSLQPPSYHNDLTAVGVQAVLAQELNPPVGVKPLRWLLLTSCRVDTFAAASQMLDWYACRWLIERYHFVLKSGCHLEALQLSTRTRLEVALAVYSVVAWRLLYLCYQAREQPDQSCEPFLSRVEWQALYCQLHRTSQPPASAPSLRQAVFWLARLGGFLARRGDGEPGVQVLWRGLQRLQDLAAMWQLLQDPNCG